MPVVTIEHLPHFAFCDPASGRQELKRTRARSAVVCVALGDPYMLFVRYAHASRQPPDRLIDEIVDVNERFRPRAFGIEANGMQSVLGTFVMRDARFKGVSIPLRSINQPTGMDKTWRIRNDLQPLWKDGRIVLKADQFDLKTELQSFPLGNTVDLVDALASIVRHLAPPRKMSAGPRDESDEVAAYLRAKGVPPEQIQARVAELRVEREHGLRRDALRSRPLRKAYGDVVVG